MKRSANANPCPFCGGCKNVGRTSYSVDLGTGMIVVRDVPTTVCSHCGEKWFDIKTAHRLEQIIEAARERHYHYQVEVLAFHQSQAKIRQLIGKDF